MAQGLPRTRFNTARLVRVLADFAVAEPVDSKQSFADRLGQWLGFNDALALFSALNPAATAGGEPQPAAAAGSAAQACARVRATLAESIVADGVFRPGKARIELPTPLPNASPEEAADFAPYHRYYLAHQRDMNASICPLRATVRAALARRSGALKRLAALDAVMDQALAARERTLLATVPGLLAKRFEQLFTAHQAALAETQTADDTQRWMQPGGWLAAFCRDMQAVLLAELELRLQPVAGLVEALEHEPAAGAAPLPQAAARGPE